MVKSKGGKRVERGTEGLSPMLSEKVRRGSGAYETMREITIRRW